MRVRIDAYLRSDRVDYMRTRQVPDLVGVSDGDLENGLRCLFDAHTWLGARSNRAGKGRFDRRRRPGPSMAFEAIVVVNTMRVCESRLPLGLVGHSCSNDDPFLLRRDRRLVGRRISFDVRIASERTQWSKGVVVDGFETGRLSHKTSYRTSGTSGRLDGRLRLLRWLRIFWFRRAV